MNHVSTIARNTYTEKLYTLLITNPVTGKVTENWNKDKYIQNVLDGLEDDIIILSNNPEDVVIFNNDTKSLNPLTKTGEIPEIKLLWVNALIETGAEHGVEIIYDTVVKEENELKTIVWNLLALPEKPLQFKRRRNIVAKDFNDTDEDTNFKKCGKHYFNPQVKAQVDAIEKELEVDKLSEGEE